MINHAASSSDRYNRRRKSFKEQVFLHYLKSLETFISSKSNKIFDFFTNVYYVNSHLIKSYEPGLLKVKGFSFFKRPVFRGNVQDISFLSASFIPEEFVGEKDVFLFRPVEENPLFLKTNQFYKYSSFYPSGVFLPSRLDEKDHYFLFFINASYFFISNNPFVQFVFTFLFCEEIFPSHILALFSAEKFDGNRASLNKSFLVNNLDKKNLTFYLGRELNIKFVVVKSRAFEMNPNIL